MEVLYHIRPYFAGIVPYMAIDPTPNSKRFGLHWLSERCDSPMSPFRGKGLVQHQVVGVPVKLLRRSGRFKHLRRLMKMMIMVDVNKDYYG